MLSIRKLFIVSLSSRAILHPLVSRFWPVGRQLSTPVINYHPIPSLQCFPSVLHESHSEHKPKWGGGLIQYGEVTSVATLLQHGSYMSMWVNIIIIFLILYIFNAFLKFYINKIIIFLQLMISHILKIFEVKHKFISYGFHD